MTDSLAGLANILPLLDIGEALLLGDVYYCLDKPVITPDSAIRDFWKEWVSQSSDAEANTLAVEALRSQTRAN